jgi:myo-inositol-hexaphosphate 3-phosphohydrolase
MRWRLLAFALVAWLAAGTARATTPVISPLDRRLEGPGRNIGDPCFWADPADPAGTLVFVTAKDSGLVEVFNLASGTLVGTIPGFGRPDNCAVEGDLLLTTDRTARHVSVHHLPDLTLLRTFGEDMKEPQGIDVLTRPAPLVYVTDHADSSVHVYALDTGALVRSFPTGFGTPIESILVDDRQGRVFLVGGAKSPPRSFSWFTPEGALVQEVGRKAFDEDAEGMALYACGDGGYIVAADQRATGTEFEVFDRVSLGHLGTFRLEDGQGGFTDSTDGIDILQTPLPAFPYGVLAACDGCGPNEPEGLDVVAWERVAAAMGLDLCPGGRAPDCVAIPCTERLVASADTFVARAEPGTNFGREPGLEVESDPPRRYMETLLRFLVPEHPGLDLEGAMLRLTVSGRKGSDSKSGGVLFQTTGSWDETAVTYTSRPRRRGRPIARVGSVSEQQAVDLDVTRVVRGGGTYDFMLHGTSSNKVRYRSREEGETPPTMLLTLRRQDPTRTVTIEAAADGYVAGASPRRSFGTRRMLRVGSGRSEKESFLRFSVSGTAGRAIERALLRLSVRPGRTVTDPGAVHGVADTGWQEDTLTYLARPPIGAPLPGGRAPIRLGDRVEFDVTSAVGGDGPVAFALSAGPGATVEYRSREAARGRPELVIILRAAD